MKIWNAMLMRIVSTVATVETNFMALFSKSDGLYLKVGSAEQKILTSSSPISSLSNVSTATPSTGDVLAYNGSSYAPTDINAMKVINVTSNSSLLCTGNKVMYQCSSTTNMSITLNLNNMDPGSIVIVSYTSTSNMQRQCTVNLGLYPVSSVILSKVGNNTLSGYKYRTEIMLIKGALDWQILSTEKTYT